MKIPSSPIKVYRESLSFDPDQTKVITRFFQPNKERQKNIIQRILKLSDNEVDQILKLTIANFSHRHENIKRIFKINYDKLKIETDLPLERRLLIGSYFTMEYAIETAALINPSIVPHPNQEDIEKDEKRVILSFRAVGEGHMSSIVFREGIIKKNGCLVIEQDNTKLELGKINDDFFYDKKDFVLKLKEINSYESVKSIFNNLLEKFSYTELNESTLRYIKKYKNDKSFNSETIETLIWFAKSNFEIDFDEELDLSGRVLFPRSKGEIKALEDARFVQFQEMDGSPKYYATYTAYDGRNILPQLIETKNFYRFKIITMMGSGSQNKGMALFPEKIKGKYVMLSRNDNENLYLMYSNRINYWEKPILLRKPTFYWEFFQIGNNGSPLKTEEGWLVLTHGVGPVRTYCIGAILLDLDNPNKIIKATREPILFPLENERNGYVPNVVYSCGSIIHQDYLIMPYAISDTRSGVAKFNMKELLNCMERC
ncbi:MAG: glycoside hydrolase family 130 protein [Bacteroidetes bacterium]|nr:glycoside hydrolase family 130 protein [Bacteroidota bacterium]